MRTSARIFFALVISVFLFTVFIGRSFAQSNYISPDMSSETPQNMRTFTQSALIEIMAAIGCQITGKDIANRNSRCLGINENGQIGYVENGSGLLGIVTNLIGMTFTPPASGIQYTRYLASNFGIAKPTYAQGLGMTQINPLSKIWIAFRDITYIVFIVVFVLIGMAIMLRLKIDPRTVMGIQNTIPRIIIGIILVTFSFAIVGFLIDLMWLLIYAMYGVFASIDPKMNQELIGSLNSNSLGYFQKNLGLKDAPWSAAGGISTIISSMFDNTAGKWIIAIIVALITTAGSAVIPGPSFIIKFVGGIIAGLEGLGMNAASSYVAQFIAFIIIFVAVFVAMVRLWFTLLKTYIMILIDIIFAPLWIVAGIIPGRSISFGGWLRDIVANIAAFPATFLMFLLGKVFLDVLSQEKMENFFIPPFIGSPGTPDQLAGLIGIGIVFMTPNVVNMTKQMIKAPKTDNSMPFKLIAAGGQITSRAVKDTAGSAFVSIQGSYPKQDEKGIRAVMRRWIR